MTYRGAYRLPAEFWKVVVMRQPDGSLSATANEDTCLLYTSRCV